MPREFDFYELYQAMSRHLIESYATEYDWISWPDQDEFLEGPGRDRSYYDYLREAEESDIDWIEFQTSTSGGPTRTTSPSRRRRGACAATRCAPTVRLASAPGAPGHEHPALQSQPARGDPFAQLFNLRHYPMRSVDADAGPRAARPSGLRRGDMNFHYENMRAPPRVAADPCVGPYYDDGVSELESEPIFDWSTIYGRSPAVA